MNCTNCGARLVVSGGGDHLRCDFCGGANVAKETRDGVRALGEETDRYCPICERLLVRASIERAPAELCPNCEGFLIDRAGFAGVVLVKRAMYDGPELPRRPVDPEEGRRQIRCPACKALMDTDTYQGPGAIWIDSCDPCGLVWLDRGELTIIERW